MPRKARCALRGTGFAVDGVDLRCVEFRRFRFTLSGMPPKLSTHVLDTANGCPAAGMRIDLFAVREEQPPLSATTGGGVHGGGGTEDVPHVLHRHRHLQLIKTMVTNADGRNGDGPLLNEESMRVGLYELHFHVGDYFRAKMQGSAAAPPGGVSFLDIVPVAFGIPDAAQGYHVPLLCSQWSYSTYRGS